MKGNIAKRSKNCFKTLAILSLLALMMLTVTGQAQAWDLKEAAKIHRNHRY